MVSFETKVFNFGGVQINLFFWLLLMLFMSYLGILNPKFPSKSFKFYLLHLGLSFILSELLYMVWGKGPNAFFHNWLPICSRQAPSVEKTILSPLNGPDTLAENQIDHIYMVLFLNSIPLICMYSLILIPHNLDYRFC